MEYFFCLFFKIEPLTLKQYKKNWNKRAGIYIKALDTPNVVNEITRQLVQMLESLVPENIQ
ncbi:hypothetical protein C0V77_17635 [Emticicia sp. TH156]|nr:hypothetical protein C0V77_17635 [Emticicia sp. TH156]